MANPTGEILKVASRIILPWQECLELHRNVKSHFCNWHMQVNLVDLYLVGIHTFHLKRILLTVCLPACGNKTTRVWKIMYNLCACWLQSFMKCYLHHQDWCQYHVNFVLHVVDFLLPPPTVLVKMFQQVLQLLGKTSTVRRVVIFI